MTELNEAQRRVLETGRLANFYISVSELADPDFQYLLKRLYLKRWSTEGGFPACRTTDAGRAALEAD